MDKKKKSRRKIYWETITKLIPSHVHLKRIPPKSYQTCSWAWQSTQSPEGNWLHVCSWRWHGNSSQWFHSTQWPRRSAHLVGCSPLWSRWCEWTHGAQTRTQWVGIHHHLWVVSMTMWRMSCQHQRFLVAPRVDRVGLHIQNEDPQIKTQLFKSNKTNHLHQASVT